MKELGARPDIADDDNLVVLVYYTGLSRYVDVVLCTFRFEWIGLKSTSLSSLTALAFDCSLSLPNSQHIKKADMSKARGATTGAAQGNLKNKRKRTSDSVASASTSTSAPSLATSASSTSTPLSAVAARRLAKEQAAAATSATASSSSSSTPSKKTTKITTSTQESGNASKEASGANDEDDGASSNSSSSGEEEVIKQISKVMKSGHSTSVKQKSNRYFTSSSLKSTAMEGNSVPALAATGDVDIPMMDDNEEGEGDESEPVAGPSSRRTSVNGESPHVSSRRSQRRRRRGEDARKCVGNPQSCIHYVSLTESCSFHIYI